MKREDPDDFGECEDIDFYLRMTTEVSNGNRKWIVIGLFILLGIVAAIIAFGCARIPVKEIDANLGFQPLAGAKVAEELDIGDRAAGNIEKPTTEIKTNEIWAYVISISVVVAFLIVQEIVEYYKDIKFCR